MMDKKSVAALFISSAMMMGSIFTYASAYDSFENSKTVLEEAKNVKPLIVEVEKEVPVETPSPISVDTKNVATEEEKPIVTEKLFGNCRITAYCACEKCCGKWAKNRPNGIVYGAAGEELISGVSVACSLPFGTKLKIDGFDQTFVVHDRTSNWVQEKYGGMTVDIYIDSHEGCYEFMEGIPDWADVYIVEENV